MKYLLIALLVVLSPLPSLAQKHNLYADVGISSAEGVHPGFSLTYNYRFVKNFGVGFGVQGYNFYPTSIRYPMFVPAVFLDLRLYISPTRKNQLFTFIDLGINFYDLKGHTYNSSSWAIVYNNPSNNGFYTGFGFGYFRQMTKRGGGLYGSLKLVANWTIIRGFDHAQQREIGLANANGRPVMSVGFKF